MSPSVIWPPLSITLAMFSSFTVGTKGPSALMPPKRSAKGISVYVGPSDRPSVAFQDANHRPTASFAENLEDDVDSVDMPRATRDPSGSDTRRAPNGCENPLLPGVYAGSIEHGRALLLEQRRYMRGLHTPAPLRSDPQGLECSS